ncbi:hypothetical protein [Ekhidna sp.]|uniref:hypothetical protein n=1 Tax=Ekhidna sp. TaxID=2608089 RepID=UPI003B5006AC
MNSKVVKHLIVLLLLSGCANNSEEDLNIVCLESLEINVSDFKKSDCEVPGFIEVTASGGEEPYTFSINGVDFVESNVFSDLFAGNFVITAKDALGCTAEVSFKLESEPTGIELTLETTKSDCTSATGTLEAIANGGSGTLQFSLNEGAFAEQNTFSSLAPGEYSVTVKDDENCQVNKTVRVNSTASLESDIIPIITNSCAISGCHNGSQSPNLTTSSSIISNAIRIKSETQARSMPRGSTLPQSEIDLIACWVDDGALDN